jgi:hypothetical protein
MMLIILVYAQKGFIRANTKFFVTKAAQYAYRAASATIPRNNRLKSMFAARLSTLGNTSRQTLFHELPQRFNVPRHIASDTTIQKKTAIQNLSLMDSSLRQMVDTLLKYDPKGRNATRQLRDFNVAIDSLAKSLMVSTDKHGFKEKIKQKSPHVAMEVGNLANQLLSNLEYLAYKRGSLALAPTVVTYNSVMHVWAKAAYHVGRLAVAQAEHILESMIMNQLQMKGDDDSQRFPCPNVISFNTVIDAYAKCGESDAGYNAERILKRMETWSTASSDLNHQNKKKISIAPNTHSFSSVIQAHVLSGVKDPRKGKEAAYRAQAILDEMLFLHNYRLKGDVALSTSKERCIIPMPNTVIFHSVINAYANSDLGTTAAVRAEQILETMLQTKDARPTAKTLSHVIHCWAKSKSASAPARAESLLRRMEKIYLNPNKVILTSLIHTWVTSNSPHSAVKANALLDHMLQNVREKGDSEFTPSIRTFNLVLDAWAKISTHQPNVAVDRIFNILQQMSDLSKTLNDKTILPDILSCHAALHSLSNMGGEEALSRALTVLKEMESNDQINPDIRAYNLVLICMARSGKADAHEEISSFLQSLEEKALREGSTIYPNRISYNILIDVISKSNTPNQAELAVQALENMMKLYRLERDDIKPDLYTYTCVLNACAQTQGQPQCRTKALKLAVKCFEQMQYPPLTIEPNAFAYGAMLHAIRKLSSSISERDRLLEGLFFQCSERGYLSQEFLDCFRNSASEQLCLKLFGSLGAIEQLRLHQVNAMCRSRAKTNVRRRTTQQ